MGNGLEIRKETFVKLDAEGRSEVLYDYLDHIIRKLDAIEKREKADMRRVLTHASLGGVVGGVATVVGYFMLFKIIFTGSP